MVDENSMVYWWPKVSDAPVPKPYTVMRSIPEWFDPFLYVSCHSPDEWRHKTKECRRLKENIRKEADRLNRLVEETRGLGGYPVFLRTDQTSCKHSIAIDSPLYFIGKPGDFTYKPWVMIIECHELADIKLYNPPYPKAFYIRQWLEIKTWTVLPGRLALYPYNRIEARLLVSGETGKPYMVFPYYHAVGLTRIMERWGFPDETIDRMRRDYRKKYAEIVKKGIPTLVKYASILARRIGYGLWSMDFAYTRSGEWYFIDMAKAEDSWVPEEQDHTVEDIILADELEKVLKQT